MSAGAEASVKPALDRLRFIGATDLALSYKATWRGPHWNCAANRAKRRGITLAFAVDHGVIEGAPN